MDVIEQLHRSLDSRVTPEAVCGLIVSAIGDQLGAAHRRVLHRAASSRAGWYSSMSADFERPVPAEHKVRMLLTLLDKELSEETVVQLAGDPWRLLGQLRMVAPFVGWHPGADFASRLNREQRHNTGVGLSRRQYNRLVRQMLRTQARAKRLQEQILLRQLVLVGRSGLAYSITVDEMRADPVGACFVAYWAAQRNRRRGFTLSGRDSPFDTIAEMLLAQCVARAGRTDWWMIARAYPNPGVLARLSDERRGELMGHWFGFMRLAGEMLHGLYDAWPDREIKPVVPDSMWKGVKVVDLGTMIVRRGVDSSTWNTVAQAYNAARAGWLNCVAAAGAVDLLDEVCPGKAMRLMAADLAAMHRRSGSQVDPETRVWAALPMPWEVLDDTARIGRDTVEWACRAAGVDPHTKGWTAPRQVGGTAGWKATPELVHGIEVADPLWAGLLRRAGVFSGKAVRSDAVGLVGAYVDGQAAGGKL